MTRFLFIVVLTLPLSVHAELVITEIMYDLSEGSDAGREWIEIYNTGADPIDLTKWKISESGKNHKITVLSGTLLQPLVYAVIADNPLKLKGDCPAYAGLLFDSAFSLNNDGESLALVDGSGSAGETAFYTSREGNGTGDSLQRNAGGENFMAGIPTPGVGIPAAGLIRSPPQQKASKKVAQKESVSATSLPKVRGTGIVHKETLLATASLPGTPQFLWWLSPFLLATIAACGVLLARHYKKDEWDIVEEIE